MHASRFGLAEGLIEVLVFVVGVSLAVVYFGHLHDFTVACGTGPSCFRVYHWYNWVAFFAGIASSITAAIGLTWNIVSHSHRLPGPGKTEARPNTVFSVVEL